MPATPASSRPRSSRTTGGPSRWIASSPPASSATAASCDCLPSEAGEEAVLSPPLPAQLLDRLVERRQETRAVARRHRLGTAGDLAHGAQVGQQFTIGH